MRINEAFPWGHIPFAMCLGAHPRPRHARRRGVTRETAYHYVQRNAMAVWKEGGDFAARLKADPDIRKHLTAGELDRCFDLRHTLKSVDYIFKRVFARRA